MTLVTEEKPRFYPLGSNSIVCNTWDNFLRYARKFREPNDRYELIGGKHITRCLAEEFSAVYNVQLDDLMNRYVEFPDNETLSVFLLRFKG